ncbi:serine protease inhibitor 77Ba [Anoplophora glabripennis]|uniref:serine protease inhibitor 77Ba n=1 Tax=Anoplophora glabripennis TaxID=217634 RepID=UPI0008741F73|nr:serine protease inhibitor 77Ba [Anoplophora glabripennis]
MKSHIVGVLAYFLISVGLGRSQQFSLSDSVNAFAIDLLEETINLAGDSLNVAISPYTVWSLMNILAEGSRNNTARQLENALRIPQDKTALRKNFQNFTNTLLTKTNGATLDIDTAMFTNENFPLKNNFRAIIDQYYKVAVNQLDFKNSALAASSINKHVALVTRDRIKQLVIPADVKNAQVFLTSVLYFKGLWKMPFNTSATHKETFYDEKNNKISEVDMMFQIGVFPYSRMEEIKGHVLDLPYGQDRKMSMIVILPFKGESITGVLNYLSKMPFSSVIKSLEDAEKEFVDEDIHVYLPKFKISSDFVLNGPLIKIGIKDVFSSEEADLVGMFDHFLYVSKVIQKAEIEVNEEGTIATAASGAALQNKSQPPKFRANRPFLYFIVDRSTRSVMFAGKVTNPNITQ